MEGGNSGVFRQDLSGQSSSTNLHGVNHASHPVQLVELPMEGNGKQPNPLKEHHQLPPQPLPIQLDHPPQQLQQQSPDRSLVAIPDKLLFHEPNQQRQQEGINQKEQEGQSLADILMVPPTVIEGNEGLNKNILREHAQQKEAIGKAVAGKAVEEATRNPDPQKPASKKSDGTSILVSQVTRAKINESETIHANADTNSKSADTTTAAAAATTQPAAVSSSATTIAQEACKKVPKKPRAKPGFGLRTSRTTIVETGQKRRSCICTNSKLCNELMTRWAKVSPPDYHYVQLPREHIPVPSSNDQSMGAASQNGGVVMPGKTNRTTIDCPGESSNNNDNTTNMSDTDVYKNGFRFATLRNIQAKNPLPKDERVALCHYHPEVRPYLFWPKNTPSAQKYAIPISLAIQLGYDTVANKCQGFNAEKYCYAVPTYGFEDAKKEIGSVEKAFNDRVSQIKTNPTQFVRDLRQCEEELKEVNKLRRRNTELLRRLDDRRRTIKRLKSVLKVQRHATKEAQQQQQQLVVQAASANAQAHAHAVSTNPTIQQQYQQHAYQTTTAYHQQQQMVDPSQQQQQAAVIPQPLGQQTHNQFFQPPPPTQEQQAIGIVVGGITQNAEQQHQQHEQQHHWTYTQYNANAIGSPTGADSEQQHSQQQVQLAGVHPYDPTQHQQQHEQHQQQQPVPSPMDDHNNPGNSFSYAQQLEAAMAAAVAAGFKDDQEDVDHHQHHGDIVGDVVDLDGLEHHDGFGGDDGEDDDLEDDDWSDTEQYRQSTGGGASQNNQRPRKWPRKTVVLPPVPSAIADIPKKSKRSSKAMSGNSKKRAKTTKSITSKAKKSDSAT